MGDHVLGKYHKAGNFAFLSGILHLPASLFGGFSFCTGSLTIIGLLWCTLGLGLRRRIRILAYVGYIAMVTGALVSLLSLHTPPFPSWWWSLIFLADLASAFFLFQIIWSK